MTARSSTEINGQFYEPDYDADTYPERDYTEGYPLWLVQHQRLLPA